MRIVLFIHIAALYAAACHVLPLYQYINMGHRTYVCICPCYMYGCITAVTGDEEDDVAKKSLAQSSPAEYWLDALWPAALSLSLSKYSPSTMWRY